VDAHSRDPQVPCLGEPIRGLLGIQAVAAVHREHARGKGGRVGNRGEKRAKGRDQQERFPCQEPVEHAHALPEDRGKRPGGLVGSHPPPGQQDGSLLLRKDVHVLLDALGLPLGGHHHQARPRGAARVQLPEDEGEVASLRAADCERHLLPPQGRDQALERPRGAEMTFDVFSEQVSHGFYRK
jgi:hypothetical protein